MQRRDILSLIAIGVTAPAWADRPMPAQRLIAAAESQIGVTVGYDPAYVKLAYPNGDVNLQRGVCTDVVIRAYRQGLGVDLQRLVHEDMGRSFNSYPQNWGLKRPDSSIDHRRVPNLQRFFERSKAELKHSNLIPGDLVTMMLPGNLPHIAIVSATKSAAGNRFLAIHNKHTGKPYRYRTLPLLSRLISGSDGIHDKFCIVASCLRL
jgi:uncharacterized protein